MQIIAGDAGSGTISDKREHERHLSKYFYLKTDASGKITEASAGLPLPLDQLAPWVYHTINGPNLKGEVEFHDETYTYLKVPLKQTPGFVVTFFDLERDSDILHELLLTLSIGGLVCLVLTYYGSRFMAYPAMTPIKTSWQRQQDFVADASHELRTPLTVIQVNLELVQGNPEETVASSGQMARL